MLALSRKKGESIIINNNIELTILEIKGDQIKLGIDAPKSIPIYRKEIYGQIQQENKISAGTDDLNKTCLQDTPSVEVLHRVCWNSGILQLSSRKTPSPSGFLCS